MARIPQPVQAIRTEIDALFTEGRDLVEVSEDVTRLGARPIIQSVVEPRWTPSPAAPATCFDIPCTGSSARQQ